MLNNFIYAKKKALFLKALNNNEVLDEAIVFIEDTKEIWNHGTYFDCSTISDLEAIRQGAAKGATAVQPSQLANVATTGSYNDLTNKPTIPAAITESIVSGWGFTKNTYVDNKVATKQDKLVSGINIKTINNTSILGNGNINVGNISIINTDLELIDPIYYIYYNSYFTIEALEDGLTASLSDNACEYSLDGNTWNNLSAATNTPAVNTGEKIYFKGNITPASSKGIGTFTISTKCNVKGNIMSLLYGDDFIDKTDLTGKTYAFYKLFYNCTNIVDALKLVLPATTLANICYYYMFSGCTSLTTAPELPATTLAIRCYQYMFSGCTSLTTAPKLPATTLATRCYANMFYGCTSLTAAPELPATTLASACYDYIFQGCTSLTTASQLPATTLADNCYSGMFRGCSSLTAAPELPATTLANWCYSDMFRDCSSLTAAPELPATTLADSCYNSMFEGCTGLTTAPELPVTTLEYQCYSSMFYGCTSLTVAPRLPATTLANSCYQYMFYGCSNLNYITMLATDISADSCLSYWVNGVANTGTFVKNVNMTSLPRGTSGIPNRWTVENV